MSTAVVLFTRDLRSLRDLGGALRERGGRLVVRRGDPAREVLRVASECGAERSTRART